MAQRFRHRSSRRSVSLLWAFFALVVLLGILNWLQSSKKSVPAVARLVVLSGEATITRADAGQDLPLISGQLTTVQTADTVSTGPEAKARLTFGGGETLDLAPQTRLTILELYQTPVSRALHTVLALHEGSVLARIRHMLLQGVEFTIETRVATLQVRGTAFECAFVNKNELYVAVYEGVVNVSMGEQVIDLEAGQGLRVQLGQPLVPIVLTQTPLPDVSPALAPTRATATWTIRDQPLFPPIVTPTRPGDTLSIQLYTVQEGDTLYSLSRKFGVPWETIWEANKDLLPKPELLRAGQQLRIPAP